MYRFVMLEYRLQKGGLKPDQFINLVCTVGGVEYDIYSIGAREGILEIDTQFEKTARRMLCPVEQVSFAIVISKKTSKNPPREIGFKAIEEEHKKEVHKVSKVALV
jgi:hypothetical protein